MTKIVIAYRPSVYLVLCTAAATWLEYQWRSTNPFKQYRNVSLRHKLMQKGGYIYLVFVLELTYAYGYVS
jgi:hypothetical protein